jgi:hypothetical protein
MLQRVCWYTDGFQPLKIWLLKTLHDRVMNLAQSKLPPDEIGRQMILRTSDGSDRTLSERLFSPRWVEEWQGREKEVAYRAKPERKLEGFSRHTAASR